MKRASAVCLVISLIVAGSMAFLWWKERAAAAMLSQQVSVLETRLAERQAVAHAREIETRPHPLASEPAFQPVPRNRQAEKASLRSPEMRAVKKQGARNWVAQNYAGFFRRVRLPGESEARVRDLLSEKRLIPFDVAVVRDGLEEGGKLTPAEVAQLIADAEKPLDAELAQLLGQENTTYLAAYVRNLGGRRIVDQWMLRAGTGERFLTDEQTDIVAAAIVDSTVALARTGAAMETESSDSVRRRLLGAINAAAARAQFNESQKQLLLEAANREADAMKERENLRARNATLFPP